MDDQSKMLSKCVVLKENCYKYQLTSFLDCIEVS
jgi:hypothetical protein